MNREIRKMTLRIGSNIVVNASQLHVDTHMDVLLDGFAYEFIQLVDYTPWQQPNGSWSTAVMGMNKDRSESG